MWEAVATLVGLTVGAGILAIPYMIAKAGLLLGVIDILIIGSFMLILHLYFGEVVLRTKGNHQLTGYAEKYLGKKGKIVMAAAMIITIYGALIAYLIASGEIIFSIFFGGSPFMYGFLFFMVTGFIIYIGIKAVKRWELIIATSLFIAVIFIVIVSANKIVPHNFAAVNFAEMFTPYGVILFSLFGIAAIPEMKEELKKRKKELKNAIIIGLSISILITLIFSFVVIGVVGLQNFEALSPDQRIATIALGSVLGKNMLIISNVFAIFAIATSFVALGYALKEMFHFDFKINWKKSWLYTLLIPLLFFLIDFFVYDITNFLSTLSLTGAIGLGFIGILTVIMYIRAKKLGDRKPEYTVSNHYIIDYIIILLLLLGMAYEIIRLFL